MSAVSSQSSAISIRFTPGSISGFSADPQNGQNLLERFAVRNKEDTSRAHSFGQRSASPKFTRFKLPLPSPLSPPFPSPHSTLILERAQAELCTKKESTSTGGRGFVSRSCYDNFGHNCTSPTLPRGQSVLQRKVSVHFNPFTPKSGQFPGSTVLVHPTKFSRPLFLPSFNKRTHRIICLCGGYSRQDITLSLPGVINFKFPPQPHQRYNITQYGELGLS